MQEYPEQVDCVWLAVDSLGHVAAFITAGVGPIPERVLKNEMPISEIESKLLELPVVTQADLVAKIPSPESFIALAERGLFVFDWQNAHRGRSEVKPGYDLVAVPVRPIKITEIPTNLANIAVNGDLKKHIFAQDNLLDVGSTLPCLCSSEGF